MCIRDSLTGVQQGCTGVFFVSQHIAPDLHSSKAIIRVRMGGQKKKEIGVKKLIVKLINLLLNIKMNILLKMKKSVLELIN